MKAETALENIGLSPNEIKVYLALNDYGAKTAGRVAKIAKIDRSSCYNSLRQLQEKGLVSYVIIANVKVFNATGPKRLVGYIRELEEGINMIIPELHTRHKAAKVEGQVRLFKGIKGIKSIFLDMVRVGKDNFVFGSEGQFSERMPEFAKQFDRMKREKGMETRMIIKRGKKELDYTTTDYRYLEQVKSSPAVTNIYGDRVCILIWTDEPEGVIIENAAVAKAYKSYFDFMWKYSRKR